VHEFSALCAAVLKQREDTLVSDGPFQKQAHLFREAYKVRQRDHMFCISYAARLFVL